jgi:hypothetical protein
MHCDPNMLYQMLFGSIADGDVKKHYQARSNLMLDVEGVAKLKAKGLPKSEGERYGSYVNGFRELNGLREKLSGISDQLKQYAGDWYCRASGQPDECPHHRFRMR